METLLELDDVVAGYGAGDILKGVDLESLVARDLPDRTERGGQVHGPQGRQRPLRPRLGT